MSTPKQTTLLLILDGWGVRESTDNNAIAAANTPTWDQLLSTFPHTQIATSGRDVGLPDGQMGNSEVGHMSLGSGRIVYQNISRINKAIEDGSFAETKAYRQAINAAQSNQKSVHIIGLLSPGGVHSHQDHLFAMIEAAATQGASKIYVHAILDGRDTPPRSAEAYIEALEKHCSKHQAKISSIVGRFYAMDRDQRWDRVEKAYQLIADNSAPYLTTSAKEALRNAYARDENDEFVSATNIEGGQAIESGDAVIFMNFRADRARELTQAFTETGFDKFARSRKIALSSFVMTTQYADTLDANCAFPPIKLDNDLGEYLASLQKTQLRIAETEKYAHVTFFFSGGKEDCYHGEQRILIPSPDVPTYDLKPEMSVFEVTEQLVNAIKSQHFDCIVCNIANGDMVGHTGNFEAAIKAVEAIDQCLNTITRAILDTNSQCLITADHGNCEQMLDYENNQAHTQHTTGPVPLVYIGNQPLQLNPGRLADIAPTLINLMGLELPPEMTGHALTYTK